MNVPSETVSQPSETESEIKVAAENLARSAGHRLGQARRDAAGALRDAAASLRTAATRGADAIGEVTEDAADKLEASASFVQGHRLRSSLTGLRRFSRRHPATTMAAGLAIGMLAGSLFTRMFLAREDGNPG